ncbi:hypothetical protein [Paraburkholderia adhaesiva]|uniref:hypothetical protein n=1 Tax=Paraburkholderia adhaesiva TaxID=2883244 RepID=UPI001F2C61D9|nr:hypothetical protein [Paraburkholderia adhaesiva]
MSQAHATDRDPHLHAHLSAFNSAFAELGLRFRWDAQTLYSLASIDGERARIAAYIEAHHPHLLNAYSIDFLSEAILALKNAQVPGEWFGGHVVQQEQPKERSSLPSGWAPDWRDPGLGLPALAGA